METSIAQRLRSIQDAEGLTARAFARKLGISESMLSKLYHGQRVPSKSIMRALRQHYPGLLALATAEYMNDA